jgi:glycosyltransferase involved in cell wall biosynthesis
MMYKTLTRPDRPPQRAVFLSPYKVPRLRWRNKGPRGMGGDLRVLHVVATEGRRGAEMFASDLIRTLDEAEVDQIVGVLHGAQDGQGVKVAYGAPTTVLAGGTSRIPLLRLEMHSLRHLRALVHQYRPDIVQAHGGEALKHCVLAGAGRRAPIVYRRIGSAPAWISRGPRRVAYASLMRRARQIVAVSEAVRRQTLDLFGLPDEKVVTIPEGVDLRRMESTSSRESTRSKLGIPLNDPVIVTVMALSWEKDPVGHLDVMQEVLRYRPDARHVFVGEGPMRSELELAIERRALNRSVMLLGARTDVADLLAASDVLLLASRTEGMPGCVIEAGMVGLPVAAYAIAGIPEVVDDGVTGVLVPAGNSMQLAARIVDLLGQPTVMERMGNAARDRCRTAFDIRPIAARYLDLYRDLAT